MCDLVPVGCLSRMTSWATRAAQPIHWGCRARRVCFPTAGINLFVRRMTGSSTVNTSAFINSKKGFFGLGAYLFVLKNSQVKLGTLTAWGARSEILLTEVSCSKRNLPFCKGNAQKAPEKNHWKPTSIWFQEEAIISLRAAQSQPRGLGLCLWTGLKNSFQ